MRSYIASLIILLFAVICESASFEQHFDVHSDEVKDDTFESQYKRKSDESLLWGPYRSNLYFGIRPRIPRSLLSGLFWFNVDSYSGISSIRHFYDQGDNMKKANWVSYDPRFGGTEIIIDDDNHLNITIDFVKSQDGQSWAAKVHAEPLPGFQNAKTSFIWYSGLESELIQDDIEVSASGYLKLASQKNVIGFEHSVPLTGISRELGVFRLSLTDDFANNKRPQTPLIDPELSPSKMHHYTLNVPNDHVWQAKDIFMEMLKESIHNLADTHGSINYIPPEQAFIIRDLQDFDGNVHFIQNVYEGECEFAVFFNSERTPETQRLNKDNLQSRINLARDEFHKKYSKYFQLEDPYSNDKEYEEFGKEIISGLLGGLSYFYGDHKVDRETLFDEDSFESYDLHGNLEGPHQLFTLVPSRPFFPRGFLWDEGFHLLPLMKYDSDLVLDILKSWFDLIDEKGWIAREQILGPESRSKVPDEFQTQSPEIVNPPTLMLVLANLLSGVKNEFGKQNVANEVTEYSSFNTSGNIELGSVVLNNRQMLTEYTQSIYPKLKQYFLRFRSSQQGYMSEFDRPNNKEGYRWKGRTLTHCLASGIDDYPRPLPADVAELHVDLLSWIGVMTNAMKLISEVTENKEDCLTYSKMEENIIKNLEDIHWSSKSATYCDVSVDDDDENVHVCHKGYISLFPFITKLIPLHDVSKIESIVDLISDPNELWSDYGIRSLSKSDQYYRTNENYWRSPIWVNINYLVLESLQHYHEQSSIHASTKLKSKFNSTYTQLRRNLVDNVFKQWRKTGFVWENYDDETGKAQGAKNFLGWTSVILSIMAKPASLS